MGSNNVKTSPDAHTDVLVPPLSPHKDHPSPDASFMPMVSPGQNPALADTGPTPAQQNPACNGEPFIEGWGAPFSRAMAEIQDAACLLDQMQNQLRGLLTTGNGTDGPRSLDSAHSWEARLTEVRRSLKHGLKELSNLKSQYEALTAEPPPAAETPTATQSSPSIWSVAQEDAEESGSREQWEEQRLRERVRHLEAESLSLSNTITQLQGEVQDLTLLQSDLRTAVAVAERFREEAQEKLERSERERRRLQAQGSDAVDWPESSAVNGVLPGYRSLPRGVVLTSTRGPIVKSSSLMSVPPGGSSGPESDAAAAHRERRGSLETLLNQPKAIANLTEDSGSFFRRYGGSKRGVFLRWAQDRTCGYKHVVITNFSSSWADGMALCALLHSYLPDRISFSQLRPLEKRKNLQLAFQVAESVGITPLLSADHMLQTQGPDWQRVLLYVESIYQKFEA